MELTSQPVSVPNPPEIVISIEDFGPNIVAAYSALLPHQDQAIAAGKLDWKFNRNPAGKGKIAVARIESQVVGLNGFMACTIGDGNKRLAAFQSMDTIVTPAARGRGVFNRMVAAFQENSDGDLIYGFPNLNSSPGFFGKLGWTLIGPPPMLIKPLRAGIFLKRLHAGLPDFPLPTLHRRPVPMDELARFDDRVSQVWQDFVERNRIRFSLLHDATFLNWRLFEHPIARYRVFTIDHRAYVAICTERKHGGTVGYIMDTFGESGRVASLLHNVTAMMRDDGADAIFAWNFAHLSNRDAFRAAGFYSLPDRIRPIRLNFGARALRDPITKLPKPNNWHVSYLDSDTV